MASHRIFGVTTGFLAFLLLAPVRANAGTPDSSETTSASLPDPIFSRARELLRTGQPALAERLVRAALGGSADGALLCLAGEISFRRGHFAEAAKAFAAALEQNPDNARALWGLGRIDQLYFHPESAREHFARAYRLDPRDTDIILSYIEYVSDRASRSTLLRNVAALAWPSQPERAARAVAQLKILDRLQGRPPARLATTYAAYRLPLTGFRPAGVNQQGALLAVRVNGGKPVRLLLDTGARGLLIDSRSARNLNLEILVESGLRGLGDTGAGGSRLALARTVAIGDLAFDECLVEVSDHSLTSGADGVVGIDLFERFQIHLNPVAHSLELTPFEGPAAASGDSVPALGIGKLLLVNARVETGQEGLFLVDTGAAFTSVARDFVAAKALQGQPVSLQGAQGPLAGALRVGPLELSIGGRSMTDRSPVAMDLRQISQIEGVEISGILGYSLLGNSSLKIDLRNGLVEIAKAH
jgi:tetratricopeptide (TPR) repeat protein